MCSDVRSGIFVLHFLALKLWFKQFLSFNKNFNLGTLTQGFIVEKFLFRASIKCGIFWHANFHLNFFHQKILIWGPYRVLEETLRHDARFHSCARQKRKRVLICIVPEEQGGKGCPLPRSIRYLKSPIAIREYIKHTINNLHP